MYETFEHTADLGLRVRAANLDALFADAAGGLFSIIVANLDAVRRSVDHTFELAGEANDLLLFDWLNELLYVYETKRFVFCRFEVRVGPAGLKATAWGEPLDAERHLLDHEVKAITYHALKLEQTGNGDWLAEVIVDI
jgi:SHS2 domain-containing protein